MHLNIDIVIDAYASMRPYEIRISDTDWTYLAWGNTLAQAIKNWVKEHWVKFARKNFRRLLAR